MPKKRKSETAGLEEVEKSLFSTFCSAANSISQLYSLAHNQQRAGFLAGERHALVRLQQWLDAEAHSVAGAAGTPYVSKEKLMDFIQGELDRLDEGCPVQGATGVPGGGSGGTGQAPARGTFGGASVPTSHLLSQLNHCHIRPRTGSVTDGVTVAAAPAGSSCWDPATRPGGSAVTPTPDVPRSPVEHCLERVETNPAVRPAGGFGGEYQQQTADFVGHQPAGHALHLKDVQRVPSQQDRQQDSPLAGSAPGSVPPLEALDAATARYPSPFGVACSARPPAACPGVQTEGDEHFCHGEQLRSYSGQHPPQQLQGGQQHAAYFGHFNFLDNDHQSDGGGDTQMG